MRCDEEDVWIIFRVIILIESSFNEEATSNRSKYLFAVQVRSFQIHLVYNEGNEQKRTLANEFAQ